MKTSAAVVLVFSTSLTLGPQIDAQESGDLAKKLSNPLSDLVSVPFQFNWDQTVGPQHLTRFTLNVQPVIPFPITPNWSMIWRLITPFVSQPPLFPGDAGAFGIADITSSFFFAPRPGSFIWGAGPVLVLPSAAQPTLGSGKWSAGPTIVAAKQSGAVTFGALWNQVWSFAGAAARPDVSQMLLQPFFAYQATKTLTLNINSEALANWEASEDTWTAPINFSVSKLSSFGSFPASYQLGWGVYVAHQDIGPTWKLRSAITLLLPHTRN